MLAYYGYTISPNQIETGEGFLIVRLTAHVSKG